MYYYNVEHNVATHNGMSSDAYPYMIRIHFDQNGKYRGNDAYNDELHHEAVMDILRKNSLRCYVQGETMHTLFFEDEDTALGFRRIMKMAEYEIEEHGGNQLYGISPDDYPFKMRPRPGWSMDRAMKKKIQSGWVEAIKHGAPAKIVGDPAHIIFFKTREDAEEFIIIAKLLQD